MGLEEVSVKASFFDLGGDSVLGVQLISRVRDAFQVELSLRTLLAGELTVESMARTIERSQIEIASEEDVDAILGELDGLSDEEIRLLLEEESSVL